MASLLATAPSVSKHSSSSSSSSYFTSSSSLLPSHTQTTFLSFSSSSSFLSLSGPGFGNAATLTASVKRRSPQAVKHLTGSLSRPEGLRFAVVVARFNEIVTRPLLEGAIHTFGRYSVDEDNIDVVWVPGCFEVGLAADRLAKSGKYNAVVCIAAVVRGDTSHYDAVANSAASGVLSSGLNSGVPCIFGVLTCDDMDQAINRAGGKVGNKGSEAALTALEMASLFEHQLK